MGLLRGMLGHVSEIDIEKIEEQFEKIVSEGEQIEAAFKLIRDLLVFTNKRFILVDKQGVTGKKVEYVSIPYRSVSYFSIESHGHFDLEAELKIWVRDKAEPIVREFKKDKNIYEVQKTLTKYISK